MKLLLHNEKFSFKPSVYDISNKITPTVGKDEDGKTVYKENHILFNEADIEVEEIAKALGEDGKTAVLGLFPKTNGGYSNNELIEQQLFFIDIDNGEKKNKVDKQYGADKYLSYEQVLNMKYTKENALFMYHSFNSQKGWDKIRIAFALDTPVINPEDVKKVYEVLFTHYPTADISTKNPTRMFFGGKKGYTIINPTARLNTYLTLTSESSAITEKDTPKPRKKRKDVSPVVIAKTTTIAYKVPTWELLKEGKFDEARERLSQYSNIVASAGQAEEYIKKLDMRAVLGITENGGFHDIFHEEESPSASIFKGESGTYFYKCHSSSAPYAGDIFKVTGTLTKRGYIGGIELLKDLMEIEIEISTRLQQIIDNYSAFQRTLLSEDLKQNFPQIHNRFWRYKTEVSVIIDIFKEQIYEDDNGNFRLISRLTTRSLANMLGTNHMKIARILNLMVTTEILYKLSNNQIPKQMFAEIENRRVKNNFQKRSDIFELKDIDVEFINELEMFCRNMKAKSMSVASATTKAGLIASYGEDKAREVFVQEKTFELSKRDKDFITDAIRLIEFSINNNDGWILQNEVKEGLQVKWKSFHTVDNLYKKLFPLIKEETKIERGRITNALREKYLIDSEINSASTILYNNI